LGLGSWGLSGDAYGPVDPEEQDRVIARARALGVTLFETADVYAGGEMEQRLAHVLGRDERCIIVTKIGTALEPPPARKCFDADFLQTRLTATQARLQPRAIDVLLLHNPSLETLARGEALEWLRTQAKLGHVKTWGVSAGSAFVAAAAIDAGAPVVQLAFNVLWASDYREVERRAREQETGILARSVLAHGLLSGFYAQDHRFATGDHRNERWSGNDWRRRIRHLDAIRPLVRSDITTMRGAALRWVLQHELVSSAILGPRDCVQLDQLVREAGKAPPYLPPEALQALEARLEDVGARP
jgi:aryl-alcohol dehydrogenase-like predicted oxidoreductase